jgi:hypothetical protein
MTPKPIEPEVLEPDEDLPADLLVLKNFAILLDRAFQVPGMDRRVGIAPLIGLVPGVGDIFTAILSSWIVVGALRHRVPGLKIFRMVFNIVIDASIGTIPVVGDIFDFLFQENMKNVEVLLRHRNRAKPPRTVAQISLIAMAVFMAIIAAILVAIVLLILLLAWAIDKLHVFLTSL